MNIGIDLREFKKGRMTGTGRIIKSILPLIIADVTHKYILFVDQDTDVSTGISAPHITIILKHSGPSIWYDQVVLPRLLKRMKVDVFVSFYWKCPLYKVCRYIVFIHDLHFLKPLLYKGWERIKPYKFFLKRIVAVADEIVTGSEFSRHEIIRILNAPQEKISCMPYPLDTTMMYARVRRENIQETIKKYNLTGPYILSIANFFPHKNTTRLIEAYSKLPLSLRAQYKLVLIGNMGKTFLKDIYFDLQRLKVMDNVIIIDFIEECDLTFVYRCASLFIFISLYEGFGYPPLEALALGTKVLAAEATSLPEILNDFVLYCNPYSVENIKDGIVRGLSEPYSLQKEELNKFLARYDAKIFFKRLQDFFSPLKRIKIKKILVVNLGGIGDVFLSTGFLKALKDGFPRSTLDLLVIPRVEEVLDNLPFIDTIWKWDKRFSLFFLRMVYILRRKQYDILINARTIHSYSGAFFMRWLVKTIRPRLSYGRNTDDKGRFFNVWVDEPLVGNLHEEEYDYKMLDRLGVEYKQKKYYLSVTESNQKKADEFFASQGIAEDDVVIGMHLSSGSKMRRWPRTYFRKLLICLTKHGNYKVVVTGTSQDSILFKTLKTEVPGLISACGELSIKDFYVCCQRFRFFITTDTGPLHIASYAGTPLVVIFGSEFFFRYRPLSPHSIVLTPRVTRGRFEPRWLFLRRCFNDIRPEAVAQAAFQILEETKGNY